MIHRNSIQTPTKMLTQPSTCPQPPQEQRRLREEQALRRRKLPVEDVSLKVYLWPRVWLCYEPYKPLTMPLIAHKLRVMDRDIVTHDDLLGSVCMQYICGCRCDALGWIFAYFCVVRWAVVHIQHTLPITVWDPVRRSTEQQLAHMLIGAMVR